MEILNSWQKNYDTIAYIDMGIDNFIGHEQKAKEEAQEVYQKHGSRRRPAAPRRSGRGGAA